MTRPIKEQVVVITGASTGIGRATALALAKRGAHVVLASRGDKRLAELQKEISALGGDALMVPTDVADFVQVQQLAEDTLARYGGIDTWINNAAVSVYATVRNTDMSEYRRLMDVNFMGQVHGAKVALPIMQQRGEGQIIMVGSVESRRGLPLQSAYAATKAAVAAFAQSLRQELIGTKIRVTTVLPASIDTPLYQHARCKEGCEPRPVPPFYAPEDVARAIVACVEHPRDSVVVGGAGRALLLGDTLFPRLTNAVVGPFAREYQRYCAPVAPFGNDNLDRPINVPDPQYGGLRQRWPYLASGPISAISYGVLGLLFLPFARLLLGLFASTRQD
ncbi:MAG: SDR family oxidoreductase [Chloroflexota bacterium]